MAQPTQAHNSVSVTVWNEPEISNARQAVTAEVTAAVRRVVAECSNLFDTYAYRLRFSGQFVLIAAVAVAVSSEGFSLPKWAGRTRTRSRGES
ncbi:MAG: hypothetical protein AVDCRST_MAG93-9874 [uncultured Chloroflexia bacterium]|uniref:Uncharacterized protein n=1 Tax=uncultured Chloroflexia bacterium TaxID=1672391 RepID=A0A6J4NW04_9CHLR|nr:MAG: hypothetical protein AVDCRST_MAG93-9874 [uncultured Chloroflexia bacterium]